MVPCANVFMQQSVKIAPIMKAIFIAGSIAANGYGFVQDGHSYPVAGLAGYR
jgi:hypothetical protein